MSTRQATPAEIRAFLDHGEGNRRVRVHQDGRVSYYGSPDPYADDSDFWHDARYSEEYRVVDGRVVHV